MTDSEFSKVMSDQDLAILGGGEIGYVKEISSRTAARIIREAGGDVGSFPIHSAD